MIKKIGFACKYKSNDNKTKKEIKEEESFYNTTTTTMKNLNSLDKEGQYEKLFLIVSENMNRTMNLLKYVSSLEEGLRMLRITSDLLPFFTKNELSFFYNDSNVKKLINKKLMEMGDFARKYNIRLSFHPGQFCALASDNENVINNSIDEFEYHVYLIKKMGFAKTFQDFKCNIHISGKGGLSQFEKSFNRLSPEARKVITIENTEYKYGIDDCLKVSHLCPIVLDVHHAWINEEDIIYSKDKRIQKIIDSWRGVRPTMHYSQSREEFFDIEKNNKLLNIKEILKDKTKKDLAKHSDLMWNKPLNEIVFDFHDSFDIMVEAKYKNIASIKLFNEYYGQK